MCHKNKQLKLILIILFFCFIKTHFTTEEEINQQIDEKIITYGSTLRLKNIITKFHLYSNKMSWGSGSGLQMITTIKENDSNEGLFTIKEGHGLDAAETGSIVKCDSIVRLEHVQTGKNLHSHEYKSFVTDSQEVCGFGENGKGDLNDNWKLICYNNEDDIVRGSTNFFLQHVATQQYLYVNVKKSMFNEYNCRGCPIMGHREVSCTATKDKQSLWKVSGGIIFNPIESQEHVHVEVVEDSDKDVNEDL